jgi:tRNA(Ile)-lysidine synthase TilS/MesJ
MLDFSPFDIKETLKNRFGIENYVCDPSNNKLQFERVRWRKSYEVLAKEYGLGIENVSKAIERLQRANDCLNDMAYSISKEIFEEGYINIARFKALHEELKIRVLDFIIKSVFDKNNIISYSLLKRASFKICEQYFSAINLSGVILRRYKTKNVKVYKENRP